MTKIRKAMSWLAKNDKAASAEKRGDLTIQQIIGIAVSVIVVGLVAAILVILIRNAGDDASDRAQDLTSSIAGEPAVYNANCAENRSVRVATVADLETTLTATANHIDLPWSANGGYGIPTGAFMGTAASTAGEIGLTKPAGTFDVGFFAAASRLTEARYNADFDGDGEIETSEVVGIFAESDAANAATMVPAAGAGTAVAMFADPIEDVALARGNRLIVNNRDSCWRIV